MARCIVCRRETVLDDVAVAWNPKACICLCCHERDTGTGRRMPSSLRKAVTAAMYDAGLSAAAPDRAPVMFGRKSPCRAGDSVHEPVSAHTETWFARMVQRIRPGRPLSPTFRH